jgi:hypothetical protein
MDIATDPNPPIHGKLWGAMDSAEKLIFLAKLCVMIASSGYIYGNIFVT